MLKSKAAAMLAVTPARISQLIKAGHLRPEPDGSITVGEVERCRKEAPVSWQTASMKSGRKSAAQHERERRDSLWYAVSSKLRGRGYSSWSYAQVRQTWQDFRAAIQEVDSALIED
jgi:hypothetical protein